LSGASFSCGAQMGLVATVDERLEVKLRIPPVLCSRKRKGDDAGSSEEMGAFLTTDDGEPECGGAG